MHLGLPQTHPESETQVDSVDSQQEQQNADRGARTAENVRYGQAISEGGMGGKTTDSGGSGNQGMSRGLPVSLSSRIADPDFGTSGSGYGGTVAETASSNAEESRENQGYGSGSGVGG